MPLFKCIKTHTTASVTRRKQTRSAADIVRVVEFQEDVAITPGAYGHENIKVGEEYEINGHLAIKARKNTEYFEEVKDIPVISEVPEVSETPEVEKTASAEPRKRRTKAEMEEARNVSDSGGNTQQSA